MVSRSWSRMRLTSALGQRSTTLGPKARHTARVSGPKARHIPAWGEAPGCLAARIRGLKARHIAILLLCWLSAARAQQPNYNTPNAPLLGAAWYPEQWPEAAWEHDLALMEQAHFTVTRIGEFAWSRMEPGEGHYDLDWLNRAIRLAEKHHIKVVLGTPTDAPPAWLTTKYPDTLGTDANGHLREHGGRRQFSYSSPRYRQFCIAIATQLARRFGHDPNVLGWQIGNEYTDESFDPATQKQFQQFLQAKFKTLESLNQHDGSAYWAQPITAWSQIPLPTSGGSPGLRLDYKHFVTATWRSFQHDQIAAIRPLADPRQFITTNIGGLGWSDNWDHYAITEDLDLASWDEYVGQGHLDANKEAFMNDFVRGWKRRNFWVMETQPGTVNWAGVNNSLDPGETRALAWQAVGHGADAILYWQWRDALNGQEQYHGAIVGPDGEPLPIYKEIQQLGEDFERTRAALANTHPVAEAAMLVDYDSRWAIDFQPHNKAYDQLDILLRFYKPLHRTAASAGLQVDVIDPTQPLSLAAYRYLIAPSLNVIDDALAQKLIAWVREGGTLLLGPRSGMKDDYDGLDPRGQPGPLAQVVGAHVEQYYALDERVGVTDEGLHGGDAFTFESATTWAETLKIDSPDTLRDFVYAGPEFLNGRPVEAHRLVGKGFMEYLGTIPDSGLLDRLVIALALRDPAIAAFAAGAQPSPIELSMRATGTGQPVYIAVNHSDEPASTIIHGHVHNLLANQPKIAAPPPFRMYPPSGLTPAPPPDSTTVGQFNPKDNFTLIDLPPQGVAVLIPEAPQ